MYCPKRLSDTPNAFFTERVVLRVSFLRSCTCSRSFRLVTPASTAASTSWHSRSSCTCTASRVRSFSFSITTCQKYCSTARRTSSSLCLRRRRLTSTLTRANLLPCTICPPVKRGTVADTPPATPFFISDIRCPPISISSKPLSARKPVPVALTDGK